MTDNSNIYARVSLGVTTFKKRPSLFELHCAILAENVGLTDWVAPYKRVEWQLVQDGYEVGAVWQSVLEFVKVERLKVIPMNDYVCVIGPIITIWEEIRIPV